MSSLTNYEKKILKEIANNIVHPNMLHKSVSLVGKPVELILKFPWLGKAVSVGVEKGIRGTIFMSGAFYEDETVLAEFSRRGINQNVREIKNNQLEVLDSVSDSFNYSNKAIVGGTGALFGAGTSACEIIPGAQFLIPFVIAGDIASSFTFLSRHACLIGLSYGVDPRLPENIIHILSSMIPTTDSSDEGFLALKAAGLEAMRMAGKYSSEKIAQMSAEKAAAEVAKKAMETPAMIRLIEYIAARFSIVITEKELGMLVPAVGALVNGAVNIAFQSIQHQTARDYYRKKYLEEKYTLDFIKNELDKEIMELKKNKQAA